MRANNQVNQMLFNPTHPYYNLLKPYKYKVFYGSRSSAKSWTIAEFLIRVANEAKIRVLCTRELQTSIGDSVMKLLVDTINRLGMEKDFRVTNTNIYSKTGSEFIFKGIKHNFQEIKSLEGVDVTWVEECQSMQEEAWQIVLPTIMRKPGSELIISFNTGAETDSTYKRWVLNPPNGTTVHMVNFDQNVYCTDETLKIMEYDKETLDQETFENIWLGKPLKLSDAVIFKNKFVVEEFVTPDKTIFMHGLDLGYTHPTALIRCWIMDETNELMIDMEAGEEGIDNDRLGEVLDKIPTTRYWPIYYDCADPKSGVWMRNRGYQAKPVKKGANSILDGITFLKSFTRIVIHPRCTRTIEEFNNYKWKQDKRTGELIPVPEDAYNHWIDSLRYSTEKIALSRTNNSTWALLAK